MRLAVITSGFLPIPATKGGAVENLIVNLINENEKKDKIKFSIFSIYDEVAVEQSKRYKNSEFIFIKVNSLARIMDKIVFYLAKNVLKKENSHSYRFIFQRLFFLNKVSSILKKSEFDKVLLENHPTQYLALKWRKNYKKYENRFFYHCHNEFPGTYGCEKIIANTNKFICVSNFISESISSYIKLPKDKFLVLRNCIDTERFNKKIETDEEVNIRKKYGISDSDKVLLFTGRVIPEKGVKELIMALQNVKFEKYKLLIVGAPLNELKVKTKYQKEIEELISQKAKNIVFTGFVEYKDINKLYHIADIAVLPSIWDDPAPLTIIESLVCGVPIITTDSGGIPEYATNGSAVIVERDKDLIDNLSKEIEMLLIDEKKQHEMSVICKEVSKDLTLDKYYCEFYNYVKGE